MGKEVCEMLKGNLRGGATKKRKISSTALPINIYIIYMHIVMRHYLLAG